MAIDKLSLKNFRNISDVNITLHPKLNFIYGLNASGKTSLLESLYFISTGRSFKSRRVENIIRRDAKLTEFILFGKLTVKQHNMDDFQIGIKKSTILPTQIRVNKESIKSASKLAKLSPIILIDPLSFELLNGSPTQRRQFLDWGVFHVEHSFSSDLNNYINCLKQRNSLLRNGKIDDILLNVWDKKLSDLGEKVHIQRSAYFEKFEQRLDLFLKYFSLNENIKVTYSKGWEKSKSLLEALQQFKSRDIERKFTQAGPHRADIKVSIYGQPASENLSRGQQKLFIFAMFLAQMQTLYEEFTKHTVVLIDDVAAELDDDNLNLVFKKLTELDAQIVLTVLNTNILNRIEKNTTDYKMFHVEHGKIMAIE